MTMERAKKLTEASINKGLQMQILDLLRRQAEITRRLDAAFAALQSLVDQGLTPP